MDTQKIYELNCSGPIRITAVDKAVLKPNYIHLRRTMKEYVLYYMLSGELYLIEGEQQITLRPNDIFVLDPGVEHYGIRATECSYFYVHFLHEEMQVRQMTSDEHKEFSLEQRLLSMKEKGECQECCGENMLALPKYFHINDPGGAVVLTDILQRMQLAGGNPREFHRKQTECIFWEFLIAYSREITSSYLVGSQPSTANRSMNMVYDLLSYFQENYAFDFTSTWIEERYQCSYDHLNRTFKKTIGTTIFSYLNGLRISHAKQQLLAGSGTMAEIAAKCGFHDIYYFSRVFKKYTGITPGTFYRRN